MWAELDRLQFAIGTKAADKRRVTVEDFSGRGSLDDLRGLDLGGEVVNDVCISIFFGVHSFGGLDIMTGCESVREVFALMKLTRFAHGYPQKKTPRFFGGGGL